MAHITNIFILIIVFLSPLEYKLHQGKNFCLICLMLYPQHLKKCLMDGYSVYILNEWINNIVSGEEIAWLDYKVVNKVEDNKTI